MDPLTYVVTGFVHDFEPYIVLLVGFAAAVTVFSQLSLVMNMRRTMRAVERMAATMDGTAAWVQDVAAREEPPITAPTVASAR